LTKRLIILAASLILLPGCGNKIDLPTESRGGTVPFKNYIVYAEWSSFEQVTDIMVTRAQWVYIAEDSSTVKRYKRKGANVGGSIVAKVIGELEGFDKPISLDEGADQHIWVLDLTDDYPYIKLPDERSSAEEFEDRMDSLYVPPLGSYPTRMSTGDSRVVKLYDLYAGGIATTWADTAWSIIDSTWRQPGRDSANIISAIREVELTSIAADRGDQIYISGTNLAYRAFGVVEYDTNYVDGGSYGDPFEGLDHIGYDVTYQDSTRQWFVRVYNSLGDFEYEAVGLGTGLGFGESINAATIAGDYLVFVDGAQNQIKLNDPSVPHTGIAGFTGEEAVNPGEEIVPFLLDPGGVAGDPSGNIYVADSGNGRVLKYSSSLFFDTYVDQNDRGVVSMPTAIGVTDSLVYVFDQDERRVVLFEFPKNEEEF